MQLHSSSWRRIIENTHTSSWFVLVHCHPSMSNSALTISVNSSFSSTIGSCPARHFKRDLQSLSFRWSQTMCLLQPKSWELRLSLWICKDDPLEFEARVRILLLLLKLLTFSCWRWKNEVNCAELVDFCDEHKGLNAREFMFIEILLKACIFTLVYQLESQMTGSWNFKHTNYNELRTQFLNRILFTECLLGTGWYKSSQISGRN